MQLVLVLEEFLDLYRIVISNASNSPLERYPTDDLRRLNEITSRSHSYVCLQLRVCERGHFLLSASEPPPIRSIDLSVRSRAFFDAASNRSDVFFSCLFSSGGPSFFSFRDSNGQRSENWIARRRPCSKSTVCAKRSFYVRIASTTAGTADN